MLQTQARRERVGDLARQADQVGGDDHHPVSLFVFDRQRLGVKRGIHSIAWFGARRVAGHPDRAAGRNIGNGHAGFELRLGCGQGGDGGKK